MNSIDIINEFYDEDSPSREILIAHSLLVAQKSVSVAQKVAYLNPDIEFIEEAAMLHDIGIFFTNAPSIGCRGNVPYVCHGYMGRDLLEKKGLKKHALVCERHVGVGMTADEILALGLPLPVRDMLPVSLEEQIVCFADKFFSKKFGNNVKELTVAEVVNSLEKYGQEKVARFLGWVKIFQ